MLHLGRIACGAFGLFMTGLSFSEDGDVASLLDVSIAELGASPVFAPPGPLPTTTNIVPGGS
jgi:hypothetical protein